MARLDDGGGVMDGNQPAAQNINDQGPPQKKRKPMLTLTMDRSVPSMQFALV